MKDSRRINMYWFSHVYKDLNDLYNSWLFAKNKEDIDNYLTKIVEREDPIARAWHGMVRIIQKSHKLWISIMKRHI